ncbi:RtcB family protein [Solitalea lacus]|uniref:RtcB family protein n=1 Tax=Solitalea lacus TaxID=2911172 RepID=UPI001EDC5452|nr:RtcB family protein [Solitalea lacus]UKJ07822.1 RtcB family protein [Solitalea lacus]
MSKLRLTGKDLRTIGFPENRAISIAINDLPKHFKKVSHYVVLDLLKPVIENPFDYLEDQRFAKTAAALVEYHQQQLKKSPTGHTEVSVELLEKLKLLRDNSIQDLRDEKTPYTTYGHDQIEQGAINQMEIAARLPITVAGALMPDAHQGYGLPIGGVLATENAVIPYGVGVDIGCRMCLSIYDMPDKLVDIRKQELEILLNRNTLFGAGKEFSKAEDHEVLNNNAFNENPLLKSLQMKAAKQLGSSGSGNHFVEFGIVEITDPQNELNIPIGKYLSVLSHSGSRGLGATIANHYTKVAMEKCVLPKEAKHLAWLDLNTQEGQEYWIAMNLAGDYASACHHRIHEKLAKALAEKPLAMLENHHNFAWKEVWNGKEVITHRKGATPAGKNVLGIIPGSMTAPGFIVRGKGNEASIQSASHGAGRKLSRTQAANSITRQELSKILTNEGITLIGGGLDESPHAYKDIKEVMKAQTDLVETIGLFYPKIVRMDE